MAVKELKKYLEIFSKEELIKNITDIYSKNKSVKEYYDNLLQPNFLGKLQEYKTKVYEAFFPKRGTRYKLSEARKAITNFKKLKPSPEHLADIMLYYTEVGVKFTNEYGDIDAPFYESMINNFTKTLEFIAKNNLYDIFKNRCLSVLVNTEGCGWGFYDAIREIYILYYDFD